MEENFRNVFNAIVCIGRLHKIVGWKKRCYLCACACICKLYNVTLNCKKPPRLSTQKQNIENEEETRTHKYMCGSAFGLYPQLEKKSFTM